jgi:DNA-binding transcriptional MerR regulator
MGTDTRYEADIGLNQTAAQRHGASGGEIPARPELEPSGRLYAIGEIAREFRVTIRALRFYEDRSLLRPRRNGSVRWYDDRDRLHLKMILKGKQLGFTLAEIRDILAGRAEKYGKAELETELTAGQIAAQIGHLERQRGQIEEAIAALRRAQQRLLQLPACRASRSDRSDI